MEPISANTAPASTRILTIYSLSINLSSLNNVAAQQVFTQRDRADKPHDRNQQGGFEVEQAALVDAEQHQQRDGVDVHGIQRNDTIRQRRAFNQAVQVKGNRYAKQEHSDADG